MEEGKRAEEKGCAAWFYSISRGRMELLDDSVVKASIQSGVILIL